MKPLLFVKHPLLIVIKLLILNINYNIYAMYSLEFSAWTSHKENLDTEEPTEYFSKKFATVDEAKDFLINDCFEWNEGEWEGCFITLSFKNEPSIFDENGTVVSRCYMVDYDNAEFEWKDA